MPMRREKPEERLARVQRFVLLKKSYGWPIGPAIRGVWLRRRWPRRRWVDEHCIHGVLYLELSCGHLIHVHYNKNGDPFRSAYACKQCARERDRA
jgi:hypothetical protein